MKHRSREEITAWAEKQLQVAREERRLRETMSVFSMSGKTASRTKDTGLRKDKDNRKAEVSSSQASLLKFYFLFLNADKCL